MHYRILGKSALKVSVIGMGTWQFGGEWGKDFTQPEVDAMFRRAEELGINLLDTAECYGDHLSESLIGRAIRNHRDHWIVATKFGHDFTGHLKRRDTRTPDSVTTQIEASLRALQTDYIDLYQFHSWGDDTFFNDDVQAILDKLLDAGKIKHLGNSVGGKFTTRQIEASQGKRIETIQIIYNRLDRLPEKEAFDICLRQNLGVMARVPLASGLLSGKYKPGAHFKGNDVRANRDQSDIDQKLQEVAHIQTTEVPPGVDMAQWSLAWCLRHPAVSCVIPGCKSVAQVESNAAAATLADPQHPQAA